MPIILPNGREVGPPVRGRVAPADKARARAKRESRLRSRGRAAGDPLSFMEFMEQAWAVVEPGVPFSSNWHIEAIAEHLEAITRGEIKDLIISMPPRALKSRTVCVFWPAWEWAEVDPTNKWLFASYAHNLSKRDSVDCRRLIQSPWYRSRYGHVFSLVSDQNEKMRYENSRRGLRVATSVGGATTGEGGNRLVIDDPHNVRQIESEVQRHAVHEWYDKAWISRRNQPKTDARLIVAQRTHPDDLTGHVLRNEGTGEGGYYHLVLPMEYSVKRRVTTVTPLDWEDPRVEEGELLHPEHIGEEENRQFRRTMGDAYDAQYNQDPVPAGGNIVDPAWWKYWRTMPAGIEEVVISLDANFKGGNSAASSSKAAQKGSYACIQVWARRGSEKYLIERWRERAGFVGTREMLRAIARRHTPYNVILIEQAANGWAIIEDLQTELHSVTAIPPYGSKEARLQAVAPTIKAGDCYLPDPDQAGNEWVRDYIKSVAEHPKGIDGNDDGDATSQALNHMRGHTGTWRII